MTTAKGTIRHNVANIGEVTLHYAETGPEQGTLVLLLHGFPEFWYCWKDILPGLGETYHAVAPDMRGYNLSDKPDGVEAYHIRHLMQDVLDLADHFNAKKFYLVAHDWGAAIAYAVAIAHPERLQGLVILNGAHPWIFAELLNRHAGQIASSQYIAAFRDPEAEAKLLANDSDWLLDWTFRPHLEQGRMTDADIAAYRAAWAEPGAMTAMLNYYRATPLNPATEETFGKGSGLDPARFMVHVPTLVLWGEADEALQVANLEGLEDFIPDLRIIRLPGISHWVTHEAPERALAEISAFINAQESAKKRGKA